jgi:hypothetical protein
MRAAAILADGVSRHGAGCSCSYCGLATTKITLGTVTLYNAELRRDGDVEFLIADGDIIQNNSRPIVVSRKAWDAMAAAAGGSK